MTDEKDEQNIDAMIQSIIMQTQGFSPSGAHISTAEHHAAQNQYLKLVRHREDILAQRQRLRNETSLADTERLKALGALEVEQRRLQIEADRVAVEKAQVIVRALEVAAGAGVDGAKLLSAIEDFSMKLLPAPGDDPTETKADRVKVPVPLIAKKD